MQNWNTRLPPMHPAYTQFQSTFLGRLKTRLLAAITGSIDRFPSDRELTARMMDEWSSFSETGRMFFQLIRCLGSHTLPLASNATPRHVLRVLDLLVRYELSERLCF